MWPRNQLFIEGEEMASRESRVMDEFVRTCDRLAIPLDLTPKIRELYLPFAAWLCKTMDSADEPPVVGVCGGQGSGKSTLTALLSVVLEHGFGLRVASLSIDDIYKTREARQRLAEESHPLFSTRGVPMTHDVGLGIDTLQSLRSQEPNGRTAIPGFDKSRDDRRPREEWPVFHGRPDIIIFEGWCVGAVAQDPAVLGAPINTLERDRDPEGAWRRTVNEALAGEYQALFDLLDVLVLLQVESMQKVFQWRRLQERKLAQQVKTSGEDPSKLALMSKREVDQFVMHYERITRHILEEMPGRADIVLRIDNSHNPGSVQINHPIE